MARDSVGADGPLLLYIAGYGRSGSTILARVLAQGKEVVNLGEVALTPQILRKSKRPCPCGTELHACSVWKLVPDALIKSDRRFANAATHRIMLERIAAGMPNIRTIIDSSKSCWGFGFRSFRLRASAIGEVRMVHLVRDPRGVLWSQLRDSIRRGRPLTAWTIFSRGLRTSVGWVQANLAAELYGLLHPRSYVRLTYEQLMMWGLPPALQAFGGAGSLQGQVIEPALGNNHDLAGNRLRRYPARPIQFDDAWREALPKPASALVILLAWPMMLRYGYIWMHPNFARDRDALNRGENSRSPL